jgi:hypothetical protein
MKIKTTLLVLLAALSISPSASAEDIDPFIQGRILDATVKLELNYLSDPNRAISAGSGTVIFNGSHTGELGVTRRVVIATAAHVVKPHTSTIITDDGFITSVISTVKILSYSRSGSGQIVHTKHFRTDNNFDILNIRTLFVPEVDAAFIIIDLKATSRWMANTPAVKMAGTVLASRLKIGSDLLIAGSPMVMDPVIFRNRLIQRNLHNIQFQNVEFMGHLVARVLTPGNSGGGVYNADGAFIGLVTLRIGEDFGAFTGIEHILPNVVSERDIMLLLNP